MSQAIGVGGGFPRVTLIVALSVVQMFLAGRIFDHGGVRAGRVCLACQVLWCVGPVWGVSVAWSAEVQPDVVLVARSEYLFVRVDFCSKSCPFFTGVEVRRATHYVCIFGISVPAGLLYEKFVGCECGGVGTRINVVY